MDRETLIGAIEQRKRIAERNNQSFVDFPYEIVGEVLELLKEQKSVLGIQQTADSITFISTGTAQQGEVRGIVLGQARMHEWLEKELLYRGLLTDAIRAVFHDARRLVK